MDLTPEQSSCLLEVARAVIRRELGESDTVVPELADPVFNTPAGCFVTLHTLADHRLRGCIGMIRATSPLKESVQEMAAAALDDPRFRGDPVTLDELPELEIEITVLSPLEKAESPLDFDLLEHGIYLQCQGESGCFLPQVARETGWPKEQLLARLCTEKMGLDADAWHQPDSSLYRFTATIIGPEPFVF